jgi:threonylcarbamoyladenosine tRNA methylthiotransferase MtaB
LTADIQVKTFGCRLNSYESEVISDILKDIADLPLFSDKKVIIFNSCAVTTEAERQLKQSIRKARRENGSDSIIGVVGCAVQVNRDSYANMPEVDFVIGNGEKFNVENYLNFKERPAVVGNIFSRVNLGHPRILGNFRNLARAFVQIQDGCDNSCTFCMTRLARGKSVSLTAEEIVEQIKKFVDLNYREVVLTGVNICDYGRNLGINLNLGGLVEKILRETSLERLRLSSLDIAAMDQGLVESIKYEKRLMPHIHLSLQSGSDIILKRMLRRHRREEVFNLCQNILETRPELAIGADFIAGFPTETEEMHQDSLAMIDGIPIVYGHIFPYYERPGTKAALMPQIRRSLRRRRAGELRNRVSRNLGKFKESLRGTEQKVLVETRNLGRLENYLQINLDGNYGGEIGNIVNIIL